MIKLKYFFILSGILLFNQCNLPKSADNTMPVLPVPYHSTLEMLKHGCYTVGYDLSKRHAAYVTYVITPEKLSGNAKRKNNFKLDPLLPSEFSATDEDYYKSGFDRGHLCPAADMTVSQNCMDKSFYYSNMSPQEPGFNRGIWKKLEARVRKWCKDSDSLRIYTGPIFHDSDTTLGPNNVVVPQKYYKTILRYKKDSSNMIGFVLNNEPSKNDLSSFVTSIDHIEELIDLDLYIFFPDDLEMELEKSMSKEGWFN